jgi:4-diphosphocytidyl-2-C-methyl-D-erythritol kinase
MSCAVRVSAYAKINLSLRVLGVRPDGYHELRTVFQSIALHDTLTARVRRGPFALQCAEPDCPADQTNLVWRAAEHVWLASGRRGTMRDVEIRLTKRIPLRAGLGGGSSDAAAALRLFGSLWRVKDGQLREIAATLGADVPYFLEGGTVLGLDRGDLLYPLLDHPAAWVTLVVPAFGVSTKDAYGWWDETGGSNRLRAPGASARLADSPSPRLRRNRAEALSESGARNGASGADSERTLSGPPVELKNDLEGPVAARHPEIARIVSALGKAGAFHAAMSGSGSAVFGLFKVRQAAERAVRTLGKTAARTLLTRTVNRAAYQRVAGIPALRINLPFAPRSPGHS